MDTKKHCQSCQAPLAADAPRGLCPACLMKVAMATGTVAGQERPGFTPPSTEELARKFPQLEIIELIGRGGTGAVYKARQKELDRIVALKILPPGIGDDAAFAERFAREARSLARLNHPGIITIHDFGRADGLYFFVMEFVDGVNLRQLLASSRVSPREALAIVPQICDALQFAHDQGIVHRDIKPENILLDRRGRVKVADFGLAKIVEGRAGSPLPAEPGTGTSGGAHGVTRPTSALTAGGKILGTPAYMAPEQREHPGEVDHRADIYALGVVFYQMLTGELPGKSLEPPSSKVQIDVRLDEVVLRALEKKPERRYQQASEVKSAVETINTQREDEALVTPEAASSSDAIVAQAEAMKGRLRLASTALFIMGLVCLGGLSLLFLVASMLPPEGARAAVNSIRSLESGLLSKLERQIGLLYFGSVSPLVGALALVTAWQVRRLQGFALATAAVVLASLQPVLWPLTLPLGLIALAVLCQQQVRAAFGAQENLRASRGGSEIDSRAGYRLAVTSTMLVLLSVAAAPISALLRPVAPGVSGAAVFPVAVLGWLSFHASLVSVTLGWLALLAMRRSAASACSLGYAVVGVLFAPILQVVRWFGSATDAVGLQSNLEAGRITRDSLLALLAAGLLAWWISRRKAGIEKAGGPTLEFMHRLGWTMGIVVVAYAGTLVFGFGKPRSQIGSSSGKGSPLANETSTLFYANHRHAQPQPESESGTFAGHMALGTLGMQAVCDPVGRDWTCWLPDGTEWCPQRGLAASLSLSQLKQRGQSFSLFPSRKDSTKTDRELIFYLSSAGYLQTNLDRLHFECYVTNRGAERLCPARRFEIQGPRPKNYNCMVTRVPPEANVARLRLGLPEGTSYRWVEFRNVSLQPGSHTPVEVVDAEPK
jgi:tRNA A-37 threonylcarbamoyl transferase component Bud32